MRKSIKNSRLLRMTINSRARATAYGLSLLVLPLSAVAELTYRADAGVGRSDNLYRTATAPIEQDIATVGLDLTWSREQRRLNGELNIDVDYFHYLNSSAATTESSEVTGLADGALTLAIVPDRFTWFLQDTFGQAQSNPFAASTPANRENINYLTTGPDFITRFGSTGSARLFGRYSDATYEISPLDATHQSAGVVLAHQLALRSQIALNGVVERVDFDDDANVDYERRSYFVSYTAASARTQVLADVGYSTLEREDDDVTDGALVRISFTREMSVSSDVRLAFGTEITDSSNSLRGVAQGPSSAGSIAVVATSEPFESRFAELGWTFQRNRTGMGLGASLNKDIYEDQRQLNRTRWVYDANVSRELTANVNFMLSGALTNEKFDVSGFEADELHASATLSWRLGRNLGVSLMAERFDRDTNTLVGEYTENRAFLTLFYTYSSVATR